MHIDKKTLRNIFLVVAACIVLYWILHETERANAVWTLIGNVMAPFITGASLAFIANVPMRAIEGCLGKISNLSLRRVLSVLLTFILILLVLTLVFWLLIPQMIETVQSLIPKLQAFLINCEKILMNFIAENPRLMQWITDNTDLESFDWAGLVQNALKMAGNSVSAILGSAVNAIGTLTSGLMNFVISLVFSIYCLFQKETLARQGRKLLYAFTPEKFSDKAIRILRLSNSTFSNFLSGQCIEVCILGSMFAIAMAILRMPYIPLVSVVVAVTAFIPIVGAWIGCIIGAFLMLVNDPIQAVWFVGMFLVLQQIEGNLIYPRVVGTSIGLSGMWVLVAVAVGGELMGVAGMFLMIPFASVLFALLRESTYNRLAQKNIDENKLMNQPPELVSNLKKKHNKVKQKRIQWKLSKKGNKNSKD